MDGVYGLGAIGILQETKTGKKDLVHPEDVKEQADSIQVQLKGLQSLDFSPDSILWHYTTGDCLISIIESGVLYATQVSCLNDSTEVRYSGGILLNAIERVRAKGGLDGEADSFLGRMAGALADHSTTPSHAPSPYFVSCFSEKADDLSQWRAYSGGENGYAIGFRATGLFGAPNSLVVRVNYNKDQHQKIAGQIAEATVRFLNTGKMRAESPEKWADELFTEWGRRISHLGPMVKDEAFSGEKEYRLVHELQVCEMGAVRFRWGRRSRRRRYFPVISH